MVARRFTRRGQTLLAATAAAVLLAMPAATGAQDGSPAASPAGESPAAAESPAAPPSAPVNPYFETGAVPGSGEGKKVGYISLGDNVPFVKLVSDSIKEQAEVAGVELVFCDSQVDNAKALECGQQLGVQQVQGVINFQVFQESSPEICASYNSVPTIAIDIVQPPCEVAFMGANNHEAGRLGGSAMGQFAMESWNCEYDAYVSLESTAAGAANEARMGGYRAGFQEHCPLDPAKEIVLDGADRTDPALEQVSNLLPSLPGNRIVVVAINEDGILGALGAARTLGREADVFYSGQGTDPSIWTEIACNPQYIASVAYFPERYGRTTIPAIIDVLDGKEIPTLLFTEHQVITAENIREVYPETGACPA
jgi:ribose transport system substrate-binding protein